MRFRPFKKNNGIIRYRTVACPQGKCAPADLAYGGDLLWVPRLFVVCSITGTCILDADGMCAETSIFGRIAISSRGIYEGLCAVPNEEVFIELSSGELLTYLPRDSKLGYCAFTPKGMCSAWLPTLKELYKQISQCAKWLSFTETLLQQSADTMLAEYTASTMTSTPDKHGGKHKDQGRLQHLISDMRDSLRRQFEETKFWDAFRRIKAAAESGKSDYPKWIFGASVWQLGVTLWIEVIDGEKETGSKIAPLENLAHDVTIDVDGLVGSIFNSITVFRTPVAPSVGSPSLYECEFRDEDAMDSTISRYDEVRDSAMAGFRQSRMKVCDEDLAAVYGLAPTKPEIPKSKGENGRTHKARSRHAG